MTTGWCYKIKIPFNGNEEFKQMTFFPLYLILHFHIYNHSLVNTSFYQLKPFSSWHSAKFGECTEQCDLMYVHTLREVNKTHQPTLSTSLIKTDSEL